MKLILCSRVIFLDWRHQKTEIIDKKVLLSVPLGEPHTIKGLANE